MEKRRVKLFRNGRNQAVRIPRELELPGDEAILRREGNQIILEAIRPSPLLALLATLQPIEDDFPEISDRLPEPVDV
jgi:antitoxin VapB